MSGVHDPWDPDLFPWLSWRWYYAVYDYFVTWAWQAFWIAIGALIFVGAWALNVRKRMGPERHRDRMGLAILVGWVSEVVLLTLIYRQVTVQGLWVPYVVILGVGAAWVVFDLKTLKHHRIWTVAAILTGVTWVVTIWIYVEPSTWTAVAVPWPSWLHFPQW